MSFKLSPPERILLGPGPSNVPPSVLSAMSLPTVGYLDASYLELMEEVQRQMRYLFRTENEATFAITGAGTAAMECAIYNLVEPGDKVVCCIHGYFGDRMRQMLERVGADLKVLKSPWGGPSDLEALEAELSQGDVSLVTVVHGETSTGVVQDIKKLATLTKRHGALLLVDTVASLGGAEFHTDEWGVDAVYTGSQKCLSAPPGISPITFSARAMEKIRARKTPCASWYLDVELNLKYWARPAAYHHTGPINLTYALHEALNLLEAETLEGRWERTRSTAEYLYQQLENLGLKMVVAQQHRLPTLTTVFAPEGIQEAEVRKQLMQEYGIEIAGGLGDFAGRAWRIGLMGHSCQRRHVDLLVAALGKVLPVPVGS